MYYTQHQSAVSCPPPTLHHHHNRYLPRLHAAFTSIRGHLPAQHQSMSTPLSATMGGTCRAPQKSTRAPQLEAPRRSVSLPRESQEVNCSTTNTHGHTNKADDIESASLLTYPAGAASVCRLLEIAASRLRESQNRCRTAAIRLLTRALLRLEESSKRDALLRLNPRADSGQHLGDLRRVHELADELESYLATFSADFKSPSSHRPTRE
ncbi:hypothetical protein FOZ62_021169 [Perkinsus olseni]|uniref:Uncharacterized protein n=2 Tax=Perkinsus olseni TaxID=32597 RepID=A0A7J6QV88_PEROL|nr:hypothetical protein FOZ62_021169 [Perkinsus olseni]